MAKLTRAFLKDGQSFYMDPPCSDEEAIVFLGGDFMHGDAHGKQPSWADIKISFDAPPVKVVAIDYETLPGRIPHRWQMHIYNPELSNMSNTLSVNNTRCVGACFTHINVQGRHADDIKTVTIGETMYNLGEVENTRRKLEACEVSRDQNYNNWQTCVREIRALTEVRRADIATREQAQREVETLRAQVSRLSAELQSVATAKAALVHDYHSLLKKSREEQQSLIDDKTRSARLSTENEQLRARLGYLPREGGKLLGWRTPENNPAHGLLQVLAEALDLAGAEARAEGYKINAADKIREQLAKLCPQVKPADWKK